MNTESWGVREGFAMSFASWGALAGTLFAGAMTGCSLDENEHSLVRTPPGAAIILNRPGFSHEIVVSGLQNPTAMVVAPDGRFFVTQQQGEVRVVKNGALLTQPFVTVSVDATNERGLLGIALDPDFSQNGYVYVFYTTTSGGTHNRVSRFTANGDVALAGSETVLVEFPGLSSAANHNAGALHFGPDGKLYVAHGDNANTALAQLLSHPFGSVLRFNKDGSIPQDNPFYDAPVDTSDAIWAYGLRNPFTFAVSPTTGRMYANDVGGGDPEEINWIVGGANYGHGGGPDPVAPVYSYPRTDGRCAITGGTFYEPTVSNFPSEYVGKYFFADYCGSEIWYMNADGTGVTSFASDSDGHLNNPVDLDVGLDGSLYYVQRGNGAKIGRFYVDQPSCSQSSDCNDGNVCNGTESCVEGFCQLGEPLSCSDGDPCTNDSCDPQTGCQFPDSGLCNCTADTDCDDSDACTTDRCEAQMCQHLQNGVCTGARLEVEDYAAYSNPGAGGTDGGRGGDAGFEGCTDVSGCGLNIGWLDAGDFVEWSYVAPVAGTYTIDSRLATVSANVVQNVLVDGAQVATVTQPTASGGYQSWTTATSTPFSMNAGAHTIRLVFATTGQNLNYIEVFAPSVGSSCGDGTCDAAETCSTCAEDCGACGTCGDGTCDPAEDCSLCPNDCGPCTGEELLHLSHVSDDGGFGNVAGLTDGNLDVKEATGTTPNCIQYNLDAAKTITRARLLEDNAGSWHVDTWKVQYSTGGPFSDAFGYTDTPLAMPTFNEVDFPDIAEVTSVRICLQNDGPIELAEVELYGMGDGTQPSCGDGTCSSSETCDSCPSDCGACASCGDGTCDGGETCSSCSTDCGTCSSTPLPLTLSLVGDDGGWSDASALSDGNWEGKVSTGITPNCLTYDLGAPFTITSARLYEDNAGAWNVDTWKIQVQDGGGFIDVSGYEPTLVALPGYNEIDFPDTPSVSQVRVCLTSAGVLEATEIEIWGVNSSADPLCGDKLCNGSEDCTTCPWDCDRCADPTVGLDARPANSACLAGDSSVAPPTLLSQHPCVLSVQAPPLFVSGVMPYELNQAFWSDGAEKFRYFALPDGSRFEVEPDGDFVLPPGGVTIKHFVWSGQHFETRFFVRFNDGTYGAYTYAWNDAQTEAELVDPVFGASKTLFDGHVWDYPFESQCFDCHNSAAGLSLGLETRQVNLQAFFPQTGRTANQFETWNALGYLNGSVSSLPPLPRGDETAPALGMRAEAYLHVNCSHCHRPGGTGQGLADYRYDVPLSSMNVCDEPSVLAAYPGLDLLEPGNAADSVIWLRASVRGANQMPPIASTVVDSAGAALIEQWINGLTSCP